MNTPVDPIRVVTLEAYPCRGCQEEIPALTNGVDVYDVDTPVGAPPYARYHATCWDAWFGKETP